MSRWVASGGGGGDGGLLAYDVVADTLVQGDNVALTRDDTAQTVTVGVPANGVDLADAAVNAVQTLGDVHIDETWDFATMPTVGGELINNGFTLTQDATGVYLNVPSGG